LPALIVCALAMGISGWSREPAGEQQAGTFRQLRFENLGPALAGGRVTSVVGIPGNPKVYYVGAAGGGVWKTMDGGEDWRPIFEHEGSASIGAIALAPSNPELVWVGTGESSIRNDTIDGAGLYFSPDGGRTAHLADPGVHSDHHALWIDPRNPSRMIQGNDGGVWLTRNGGKRWRFLDGMPIEEDYMAGISNQVPYLLCAGLQDNNSWCGNEREGWFEVTGGDGEYAAPAPSDGEVVYADSQSGSISRVDLRDRIRWTIRPYLADVEDEAPANLKYRFNWTAPIAVSPTNANVVYLGANVLFESADGGRNWSVISPDLTRNDKTKQIIPGGTIDYDISGAETYDTIESISIAPSDPKVIWVGSDDGLVHVTKDGGKNWTDVTANIPGAPKWARVYQIGVSPSDPGSAYVSFDAHMLDDVHPYVYRTHNFGQTWQEIVKGLPQEPVYVVREDPNQKGFLVLGNDTGLYYSADDGDQWQEFPVEFPTVSVWDLQFAPAEHDLVVATHGRGLFVLSDIRPIEEMTPAVAASDFHLFPINETYLLSRFYGGMQGRRSDLYRPHPARVGAYIDYYLKTAIRAPGDQGNGMERGPAGRGGRRRLVKITITDAAGNTVATDYGPGDAGVNRYVWNLRYDGPTPMRRGRRRGGGFFGNRFGPMAAPGVYKVAVTAAGVTQAQTVSVLADPRVPAVPGAFQQEVAFALQARDMLSAVNEMINRIDGLKAQIDNFSGADHLSIRPVREQSYSRLAAEGRGLRQRLNTMEESVYDTRIQPGVGEDDIHYLNDLRSQIQDLMREGWIGYGQPPSAQGEQRMSELRKQLDGRLAAFNQLLETQVSGYNRLAAETNAPRLLAGAPITVRSRISAARR
jgi:photosystem II stability/assembly factor-like uncharacterized protein